MESVTVTDCRLRMNLPRIDIDFQDIVYTVRAAKGPRQILKGISGKFRAGELTAMMGPSGAGKSTLMNILAGYVTSGVSGEIRTNGESRDLKRFHKLSSYIMQEDLLQPLLSVQEAMQVAANLKLGDRVSVEAKLAAVEEVLTMLGLTQCRNTRTEGLSGGQRKRLSVALELVNNPPVIFLDEPTTGLDIFAINQCVGLLKSLARQGRTIVCTIHQPSAALFKLFDQVYILAKGQCVYNGTTDLFIPFLSSVGHPCPTTYNPADYIMEMLQSNSDSIKLLSNTVQNGKVNKRFDSYALTQSMNTSNARCSQPDDIYRSTVTDEIANVTFPTGFGSQFHILLTRMFLQMSRNKTMLWTQLAHHVISGVLLGGIFFGIGDDASKALVNFKFCISVLVFFMYTHLMVPVLRFPPEVKLLQREYFNRWYGLKAYYMALTISTLPLLIIFSIIFLTISYFMSSQPIDVERFAWFALFGILTGICSEGLGLAVGSTFSITNGSVIAPASIAPLLALCVYGMGYGTSIEPIMAFLMSLSFLRYGLVGFTESVYGYNRTDLRCNDEVYCHYKDPSILLRDLGMEGCSYGTQVIGLASFIILYRIIAYLALRYRLTAEFSNKILNYAAKVLRHK